MGLPKKCSQGHIYFGSDCLYCLEEQRKANEFYDAINEEGD